MKFNKRAIILGISLSLILLSMLTIMSLSAAASAPEGYCEDTISGYNAATWITGTDYELLPDNENPQAILHLGHLHLWRM